MRFVPLCLFVFTACAQTPPSGAPTIVPGRMHDAGNIHRYAADNAKLAPPAPGEDRVVFLGSSIVDYWGRGHGQFFPGKPYLNRGIDGQVSPQMLLRFRQDVIALRPKVVVIPACSNDIGGSAGPIDPEVTQGNIMSMCELARVHNIRVVLSAVLPVCDSLGAHTDRRPPDKIKALNDWLRGYAAANGCAYADYWSAMVDDKGLLREELTFDCLHPNDAGYALMNPIAEKAIAQALKHRK